MNDEKNPANYVVAPQVATNLELTQIGKYYTRGGHGFAAEDANALADWLRRKSVETVGTSNALNGADRIVDGISIQTKFHQSPRLTIGDAFDSKTGFYRYDGQLLEVPKEQFEDCVGLMRDRIAKGQVPGVTDPQAAEQIVKRGEITYKQARNIARGGNIDSLIYDAKAQAVTCTCVLAVSFSVQFARAKWRGESTADSMKAALGSGFAAGGIGFVAGIVAAQLLRTKAAAMVAITIRGGMGAMAMTASGKNVIELVAKASLGKAVYGAAAVNHVSKLLRTNVITSAVVAVAVSTPDFYRAAIAKNIS